MVSEKRCVARVASDWCQAFEKQHVRDCLTLTLHNSPSLLISNPLSKSNPQKETYGYDLVCPAGEIAVRVLCFTIVSYNFVRSYISHRTSTIRTRTATTRQSLRPPQPTLLNRLNLVKRRIPATFVKRHTQATCRTGGVILAAE